MTTSYPRWMGDPASPFVEGLARALVRRGHRIMVIAPWDRGALRRELLEGVDVMRVRYWPVSGGERLAYRGGVPTNLQRSLTARIQAPLLACAQAAEALRHREGFQILHAHWPLSALSGIAAGRLLGLPLVVTLYGAGLYTGKYKRLITAILRRADHLIYIGSYTADRSFVRRGPHGQSIIPPGIEPQRFAEGDCTRAEARKILGLPADSKIVLSVGRMVERKGFKYLLEAQSILQSTGTTLVLGGSGPRLDDLRAMARSLGISHSVLMPGMIPERELPFYYRAANVFALPAIIDRNGDTESLGLVLVEAMASGLPVVASRVGGIPDVVENGVNGLLVEQKRPEQLAESIRRLLSDAALSEALGRRGVQTANERFSWEASAERTEAVYAGMLSRNAYTGGRQDG